MLHFHNGYKVIIQMKFRFEDNQKGTSSLQIMDVENLIRKFQEPVNSTYVSN